MSLSDRSKLFLTRIYFRLLTFFSPSFAARKALNLFCTPRRIRRKIDSSIIKNAETISFLLDEMNIRGYRWNHPSDKKVLIIHGFESTATNFEGMVLPLVQKGYEVLAFDAPGHGNSDGSTLSLPTYVRMLQEITERYGPIKAYIAHSYGGLAVTHLLEQIPHNDDTRVILIAPATEMTTAIRHFCSLLRLHGKVKAAFYRLLAEQGGQAPEYFSVRRAIQHIRAQILWFHDTEDEITPLADVEPVNKEGHNHVQFVVSTGLGHRKIYRDAGTINRIVQFL